MYTDFHVKWCDDEGLLTKKRLNKSNIKLMVVVAVKISNRHLIIFESISNLFEIFYPFNTSFDLVFNFLFELNSNIFNGRLIGDTKRANDRNGS